MDELLQTIAKLQQENKLLMSENLLLRSELVKVKTTALHSELYSRRTNFIIHGLEFLEDEDLRQKVNSCFGPKLGMANINQITAISYTEFQRKHRTTSCLVLVAQPLETIRNETYPLIRFSVA